MVVEFDSRLRHKHLIDVLPTVLECRLQVVELLTQLIDLSLLFLDLAVKLTRQLGGRQQNEPSPLQGSQGQQDFFAAVFSPLHPHSHFSDALENIRVGGQCGQFIQRQTHHAHLSLFGRHLCSGLAYLLLSRNCLALDLANQLHHGRRYEPR